MKKIYLLLIAVLLSTFSTWAQDLSFTIWPEESGEFIIWYSTYKASGVAVQVDWGDGIKKAYGKAETGSDPSVLIKENVTKGKPIKIYSDYLDAIYIGGKAQAISCEANNPQLQYIYYLHDNLSPENLESLYLTLKDRRSKSNWGELHLTTETYPSNISNNIKKSNAFLAIDKKWAICSMKKYIGIVAERTHWWINSEVALKSILIPAIEIATPTTANIELRLGIMPDMSHPAFLPFSFVRIDDGTSNHKSRQVRIHTSETFWNSQKLTVKGTGASGIIKIYGAMVSHLMTSGISSLNFSGTTNMRHLRIDNSSNLNSLPGLNENKLLEYVRLYKTGFTIVDLSPVPNLKTLDLPYNYKLKYLYYNTSNLKTLNVNGCDKLDIGVLSVLKNSKKLTEISVESMGWDACALDEIYRNLYSPAPSGAQIYVEDTCEPNNFNDYEGSNKTIATNKGWKVMLEYNCGAEKQLTGDGGGCKPGAVTCLSPTNGATNVSVNDVKLMFGFGANTSQYQYKWGKDSNHFSNVTSYKTTGGNTGLALAMPKLDFNTTYYWQINVKDKNGNERMGEIWSFTTEADSKAAAATCLVPIVNGNSALLSITFGANTENYEVRWGKNKSSLISTSGWKSAVGMSGSDYTFVNLDYSTKYYFQINTRNKLGDVTNSNVWDFTTGAPAATKPGAVTNTSPADGATDIKNGELLKWTFGGNTGEHQVLLDTKYPPANVGRAYQTKMISSYELTNLIPNTKYYWQVNAKNASGTTPGTVWSFTTALSTDIYSPEDSEAIQVYAYGNALHLVSTSQYDTQVDVYNIIGQLVMQGKTNGNTHSTFNTSALSNGIYVVKVVQNNKVVVSRKVPIQNQ